jgi:hypothetical protein
MEKEKLPFCINIGIVMLLLIFEIQCTNSGEFSIWTNYQVFIPKVKYYLCCHQSPKRGRLKVHLAPQSILMIENNTNKDLIVLMSIKQEFR